MKNCKSLIIVLLIISLLSCEKNTQKTVEKKSSASETNTIKIGFSIDTLAIERWQRDLDIFINTAKELGAEVIVQNAGNSVEEQNRQLMYLMEREVDVIVVLPKVADSITDSIQKIRSKNIPVISYDRLTLNADISLYLTIDSEKVGEYMAYGLLPLSKGNNWFCILGPEEDFNMTLIKEGMGKVLKNTPVKLSHVFYTSDWNYDLSYQEMVRLISKEQIPDAIVCGNDAVASSVIQALTRYYPETHIPVCGQDADISACQAIIQGKQDFTVYKPITKLAELAAEYAVYLAKGEDITTKNYPIKTINNGFGNIPGIWLEPTIVNKENMDKVIISSGFHTSNAVYGTK